jgi:tRNA(Ile)-lysidine synthase
MRSTASAAPFALTNLREYPPSRRYLVGVSGGRDSVALLHLLVRRGYRNLIVCHLDHRLRGRASRGDAKFVEKFARDLSLPCEIGTTDIRELAVKSKLSVETAGRAARFAFFVGIARQRRCRTIFLAHHADDLVETALLNLFRGASPAGAASLRCVSVHRVGKTRLTIVRPLLGIWRRQIDAYVQEHALPFREDATNAQLSGARNRIRHRVLPYIARQLGRDVRTAVWRAAQIWVEEEALLDSMIAKGAAGAVELDVVALRKMPVALQRRIIHGWLRGRHISDVGFEMVEKIRTLLDPGTSVSKVNLPGNRYARRRAKKIFLE